MEYLKKINLDLYNDRGKRPAIYAKQGDTGRALLVTLTADGIPIHPEEGVTAGIRVKKPDGHSVMDPATINPDGTITAQLSGQALACAGRCDADIYLDKSGVVLSDAVFDLLVQAAPIGDGLVSSNEFLEMVEERKNAQEAAEAARRAAEDANAAASSADKSREAADEAEAARAAAETARTNAEDTRAQDEAARKAAETARDEAEKKRAADTAKAIENAEAATQAANTAAGAANTAAEAANGAAGAAYTAAGEAETAAEAANNAAQRVEDAVTAAEKATGAANAATEAATDAAAKAEEGAAAAEKARQSIENMTVGAETLPTGEDATVVKSVDENGVTHLQFGLPRGGTGEQGLPGTSPTVDVYKEGKVTKVTITDAEGPHEFEIKDGEDGAGAVESVNGQTGEVVLNAGDVGAYSTEEIDGKLDALDDLPDYGSATDEEDFFAKMKSFFVAMPVGSVDRFLFSPWPGNTFFYGSTLKWRFEITKTENNLGYFVARHASNVLTKPIFEQKWTYMNGNFSRFEFSGNSVRFYVDPVAGIDAIGRGSEDKPFATLTYAVDRMPKELKYTSYIYLGPGEYNEPDLISIRGFRTASDDSTTYLSILPKDTSNPDTFPTFRTRLFISQNDITIDMYGFNIETPEKFKDITAVVISDNTAMVRLNRIKINSEGGCNVGLINAYTTANVILTQIQLYNCKTIAIAITACVVFMSAISGSNNNIGISSGDTRGPGTAAVVVGAGNIQATVPTQKINGGLLYYNGSVV